MNPKATLITFIAGLSLPLAWFVPGSAISVILGWVAVFSWLHLAQLDKPYRYALVAGCMTHALAFYWLTHTISQFGGFNILATAGIFILFILISSLQFLIFVFLYRLSPKVLESFGVRGALAWIAAEICSVRIFPWHIGHTQIAFTPFVQVADILGAILVSFIMFWIAELILNQRLTRAIRIGAPGLIICLTLGYGFYCISEYSPGSQRDKLRTQISVSLVQGNISLAEKHDSASFNRNVQSYMDLSRAHTGADLIIWPETVLMEWIYEGVATALSDRRIPWLADKTNLIFGGLSFRDRETFFNSVFAVEADGTVPLPYHKMILMPFGEYTPLGDYLPWLKALNSTVADFAAGEGATVFKLPIKDNPKDSIRVAPLICYEDVAPSLAVLASTAGANLLINLTNDAWFGDSVAPYQHHLIASFRAIENRRYLLRATNTGLTAVVDPLGRTLSQLPTFQSGVLSEKVSLVEEVPLFVKLGGNYLWWIVLGLYGVLLSIRLLRVLTSRKKLAA